VNIDQNDKDPNEEFWALLGGRCEIAGDQGGDEDWEVKEDKSYTSCPMLVVEWNSTKLPRQIV